MAFGISGDVGSQFAQDIARMIAAQQLQQERERRAMMEQAQLDLNQQQQMRLNRNDDEAAEERRLQRERQARLDERQATQDREASNTKGVRRMTGDFLMQRQGPMTSDDRRALAALQVEGGDLPDMSLLNEPAPKPRTVISGIGPRGEKVRKAVTEEELIAGVPEYQEPKEPRQGPEPQYEWVTRGGKAVQIRRGSAQPGDTPYDAVANRTTNTGIGAANERLRDKRLSAAQWSLNKLKELSEQINTQQGPGQVVGGLVRRGKAAMGMDPIANEYLRIRKTAAMQFAVAIQGAANLSDQERKALMDMIPPETVDNQTAMALFEDLNEMLQAMRGGEAQGAGGAAPAAGTLRWNPTTKKWEQ